eukprot:GHVL01031184.1.p1 GENE.GHVL01031184.1~~GHVL01031184.1.p1  ORF type:complete len:312 (-),score=61.23 GHVL01031184.1:29-892(-)
MKNNKKTDIVTSKVNERDIVKFLSFFLMFFDHFSLYFFRNIIYRHPGRICGPIYAIAHGFHDIKHPSKKLIFWTIIATILNLTINFYIPQTTALGSFLIGDLILYIIKPWNWPYNIYGNIYHILFICIIIMINGSCMIYIDYGLLTLLFTVCGTMYKYNNKWKIAYLSVCICYCSSYAATAFRYNNYHIGIVSCLWLIFGYLLNNYQPNKDRSFNNIYINKFILYISRHPLELYVFHLLFIKLYRALSHFKFQYIFQPDGVSLLVRSIFDGVYNPNSFLNKSILNKL